MPKLSEFFGIAIYMYWGDHGPPHFHVRYAGHKASISIADLSLVAGSLPPRALALVVEWAGLHREELQVAWQKASLKETFDSIEPLR